MVPSLRRVARLSLAAGKLGSNSEFVPLRDRMLRGKRLFASEGRFLRPYLVAVGYYPSAPPGQRANRGVPVSNGGVGPNNSAPQPSHGRHQTLLASVQRLGNRSDALHGVRFGDSLA